VIVALDAVAATCLVSVGALGACLSAHALEEAVTVATLDRALVHVSDVTPSVYPVPQVRPVNV
jgi:hypothetical protein